MRLATPPLLGAAFGVQDALLLPDRRHLPRQRVGAQHGLDMVSVLLSDGHVYQRCSVINVIAVLLSDGPVREQCAIFNVVSLLLSDGPVYERCAAFNMASVLLISVYWRRCNSAACSRM